MMFAPLLVSALIGCSATHDSGEDAESAVVAAPSDPVTLRNWLKHPRVVEVRGIVEGIEGDIQKQVLKVEKRDRLCERSGDMVREKFVDAEGQIRKLARRAGGDDGAVIEVFYYRGGTLRFVFREHRAGPTVVREDRLYLDERGNRFFWIVRTTSAEPNAPKLDTQPYRIAAPDDEDDFRLTPELGSRPTAAFDAKPECN